MSIITSIGGTRCQSLLNYGVKILTRKFLGSTHHVIIEFLKNGFFLSALKRIFLLNENFQLQVSEKQLYIYKTKPPDFLKNSKLKLILVVC